MAEVNNISCFRGEKIRLNFRHKTTPITGWTIKFNRKKRFGDTTLVGTELTATIQDALLGDYYFDLDHAFNMVEASGYVYDVQRVDPGSEVVLSIGMYEVKDEVKY